MVHVDAATDNGFPAESGSVSGRTCERIRALHSLRIGGATHLSAGGGYTRGLTARGTVGVWYVRSVCTQSRKDAGRVDSVVAPRDGDYRDPAREGYGVGVNVLRCVASGVLVRSGK